MKTFRQISKEKWQVVSALEDVYRELVDDKKVFPTKHHLFAAGLVYGLLHNKRLDKKRTYAITKLFHISDDVTTAVVDIVFWILNGGEKDAEVWAKMLAIADGGILALSEVYHTSGDLDIPHILNNATKLWPERAKSFHNIGNERSRALIFGTN